METHTQSNIIKAKYLKGENTLNKIRKAALEVIIENGYHRTSVAEIVKRAKLTRGAFYNYWTSLDNCLSDIILAMQESIRNNPHAIDYYNLLTDPSETVKKVKLTMHLVLEDELRFILLPTILLQEKGLPDDALKKHLKEYMANQYKQWLSAINIDQKNGYILPGLDPQTIASGIMNLLSGFFHNCELQFKEFSKPMENALLHFIISSLTEDYRENNRLKSLLPASVGNDQNH